MMFFFIILPLVCFNCNQPGKQTEKETGAVLPKVNKPAIVYWTPSDINSITDSTQKDQVVYGKELIAHTSRYLGPKGSVMQISNGLNCQNCHLQAGTAVYGNNYGSVASLYPKFRPRSGKIENVYKRVKDCFERSLNGKAPIRQPRKCRPF
jgi:thiosulfate dehydrogenase